MGNRARIEIKKECKLNSKTLEEIKDTNEICVYICTDGIDAYIGSISTKKDLDELLKLDNLATAIAENLSEEQSECIFPVLECRECILVDNDSIDFCWGELKDKIDEQLESY